MCGICGKVTFSGSRVDKALLSRMCRTIVHRGPDDEGVYVGPGIGLGQRRLSIIDLRRSATAPLSNEDESVWVVFNGEIYNFQELRARLASRGHIFRTATDTEVIVHLYEEYGTDCLAHMRGMFAFAVWDSQRALLFAARDRLGKKPFCYARTRSSFVFGSEIKAVTADPEVSIAPNYQAIDSYLTFQYVPSPLTAFEGVLKLPAGHFLLCQADGTVKVKRYWEPPMPEKTKAKAEEVEEELVWRLRESIRLRMIADVPLGAFLSGGVDSGAVVALMAQEGGKPVKTFSIGFTDEAYNELSFARLIAERYQTEHHEFMVKPEAAEVLPLLVRHYNEPFADSSALPTYYVSMMARQHVTVALSGDGGDENFAGYDNYAAVARWAEADRVPRVLRRAAHRTMASVLASLPYYASIGRMERALRWFAADLPERFLLQLSILKPEEKRALYTPRFLSLLRSDFAPSSRVCELPWDRARGALDWMMCHDQHFYLPDCLMVKTDIASMANSLEVRCPLLDHEFVEFAATIPTALKRDQHGGKRILKSALRSLLPREIVAKRKTGFGVPLNSWFRGELAGLLTGTLLDGRAAKRGLFDPRFVGKMVEEQVGGRRNWSSRLWALLCLELWFRTFID